MKAFKLHPIFALVIAAHSLALAIAMAEGNSQFMSAIQFAVQEPTPELLMRSQGLVRQQFTKSLQNSPELAAVPFEMRTFGNEVVFYVMTPDDVAVPMQGALASMIQSLNGRVRSRGRSSFYATRPNEAVGGYLETVVNDTHTHVMSINAQSVPLRDLLKQLKGQLGGLSYVIPGDCAEKRIDWSFGRASDGMAAKPKTVEAVMDELATALNLKVKKINDTMIFSGPCETIPVRRMPAPPAELLTTDFAPIGPPTAYPRAQQIVFPVVPLGE